jgi:crossover junction endodeoxyribonuclease RusA
VRIDVAGIPAPQGSKRHVGGGRMVEVSRAVGPWREAVRAETQRATTGPPTGQPVTVSIMFRLTRPRSAPASIIFPAKRPDLDKLVRAVLDGIVAGGAIADDSQVVILRAAKTFADDSCPPGCSIVLNTMGAVR